MKRTLKILVATTSYPSEPYPVSGIFIKRLVDQLQQRMECTVVTPSNNTEKNTFPKEVLAFRYAAVKHQVIAHTPGGIPVAIKKNPLNLLLVPLMLLAFFLIICKKCKSHDLIFANWSVAGAICGVAGAIKKTPVVTTLRGDDVSKLRQSLIRNQLIKTTLKLSLKVICVSEAIQLQMLHQFPEYKSKIVHIPNGVDSGFFNIKINQTNSNTIKAISVGSLIPRKNLMLLIEAAKLLKDAGKTGLQFNIVGNGPEKNLLIDQAIKYGVNDQFFFLGEKATSELPYLLEESNIFIHTSLSEGRPNVILEAMAAGLAIVAPDIDGVRELIKHKHSGVLFNPRNPTSLKDALLEVLSSQRQRIQIGNNARNFIIGRELTWERCAIKYEELFRSLLGK